MGGKGGKEKEKKKKSKSREGNRITNRAVRRKDKLDLGVGMSVVVQHTNKEFFVSIVDKELNFLVVLGSVESGIGNLEVNNL